MDTRRLIEIVLKYCDRVRYDGRHYVCYPIGVNRIVVISATPSDGNRHKQVFREFRKLGVIIKELNV